MKSFLLASIIGLMTTTAMSVAQEREWVLDASEEDVYLLFGVPNTTDVGVSFWCKIGSGNISLFAPAPAKNMNVEKVTLEIGGATHQLAALLSGDEKQNSLEAKLDPQDKIVAELQSAERFSMTLGNHKTIFPLGDADFLGLLRFCNEKPEATVN